MFFNGQLIDENCYELDPVNPFTFTTEDLEQLGIATKPVAHSTYRPYTPKRMWVTEHGYTTVEWEDGTKTTAHAEDEKHATVYGGFMACVVKKLYGSTSEAIRNMNKALETTAAPAKRKAYLKARMKELTQKRIQREKERRELRIREEMERLRIKGIAMERLHREEVFE